MYIHLLIDREVFVPMVFKSINFLQVLQYFCPRTYRINKMIILSLSHLALQEVTKHDLINRLYLFSVKQRSIFLFDVPVNLLAMEVVR